MKIKKYKKTKFFEAKFDSFTVGPKNYSGKTLNTCYVNPFLCHCLKRTNTVLMC